jgi:hypothetical protein
MWLERKAVIRRPPSAVFGFMDNADAQARVTPGVRDVTDVRRVENGGLACRLIYRIVGFELSETIEATAYDPPRYVEYDVKGPITARLFGRYEPHPEGTAIDLAAYYELPKWLANPLFEAVATRFNQWALSTMVSTMKTELESDAKPVAPDTPPETRQSLS